MNWGTDTLPSCSGGRRSWDEHRVLFLVLYDVWEHLYGKGYADKQVEVEKRRQGRYDYKTAWEWALAQSQEERAKRFQAILRGNERGG